MDKPIKNLTTKTDKTFVIQFEISQKEIEDKYETTLKKVAAQIKLDGFRPGKVPLDVAVNHIAPEKVLEEVFTDLVSRQYSAQIDKQQLQPIIPPQVSIKNPPIALGKSWQIEITSCELPSISIKDTVFNEIKKINQEQQGKVVDKDHQNDHLNQIINLVIKNSAVNFPQILLDHEVEHKLSDLVDQVSQAGLSIKQYFESKKTTLEDYKKSLLPQITQEWTINLAINKIAADHKLFPNHDQIDKMIATNPNLANRHDLVNYLLTQQQVFDYLQNIL